MLNKLCKQTSEAMSKWEALACVSNPAVLNRPLRRPFPPLSCLMAAPSSLDGFTKLLSVRVLPHLAAHLINKGRLFYFL